MVTQSHVTVGPPLSFCCFYLFDFELPLEGVLHFAKFVDADKTYVNLLSGPSGFFVVVAVLFFSLLSYLVGFSLYDQYLCEKSW